MNDKLKQAFDIANYMTTLADQKRILVEEYHQNIIYSSLEYFVLKNYPFFIWECKGKGIYTTTQFYFNYFIKNLKCNGSFLLRTFAIF